MRKKKTFFVPAILIVLATLSLPVQAEDSGLSFQEDIVANLDETVEKLIALAEATPAEMFSWRPAVGVRTVSEVYMHVVGTNFIMPPALGTDPPPGVEMGPKAISYLAQWERDFTSKDEVIAKLRESLKYAKKAIPSIQHLDTLMYFYDTPKSKSANLLSMIAHAHEHLGQSIAYARSFGVAPPWSQPAPPPAKAEGEGKDDDKGN